VTGMSRLLGFPPCGSRPPVNGSVPCVIVAFTEPLERQLRDGLADGTLRTEHRRESATVLFNLVG